MHFNSLDYLIFLPIVWVLYTRLRTKWQNRMLLLASYIFYGWWDERFLFLIVLSTVVDYLCGLMIGRGSARLRESTCALSFLLGATIIFVLIRWDALQWSASPPFVRIPSYRVAMSQIGVWCIAAVVSVILLWCWLIPRAAKLPEPIRKKVFLCLSIVTNLGILGFFKYFGGRMGYLAVKP